MLKQLLQFNEIVKIAQKHIPAENFWIYYKEYKWNYYTGFSGGRVINSDTNLFELTEQMVNLRYQYNSFIEELKAHAMFND